MTERRNTKHAGRGEYVFPNAKASLPLFEGIMPVAVSLDPSVGPEVALIWRDPTDFVHEVAGVEPFSLKLKAGLLGTPHGPLLFMLFYVDRPEIDAFPFCSVELYLDPQDPAMASPFQDLSRQTHIHLVFLDAENEIVDVKEFENIFGLDRTLQAATEAAAGSSMDFAAAKLAVMTSMTGEDLYRLG
jgi:hypothetical protein